MSQKTYMKTLLSFTAALLALTAAAQAAPRVKAADLTAQDLSAGKALNERLLTLDTHLDTPALFARPGWKITDRHDPKTGLSQVDYPRLVEGGLKGGFFAIYTSQGPLTPEGYAKARDEALLRAVSIHTTVAANADKLGIAHTAEEARQVAASGRRVVFLSIENSSPLGEDLTLFKTFHALGVRLAGPVHFLNNQLADSSTDPKGPQWNGFSPLGRQWVTEANRLGIVIDLSHASDAVLEQAIELSATPVILSHSGLKAVFDHPRNIDDRLLRKLADSGGVIQINSYSSYLIDTPTIPERQKALREVYASLGKTADLTPEKTAEAARRIAEIDRLYPVPRATVDDVLNHLFHAIEVVGVDHVGIGLDFDGGGGVTGLEDVSDVPVITAALLKAGYSETDIAKIWGGNALRVLEQARTHAEKAPE